jgi:pimeloyl-ACP methyl ester carboxylesterase
MRFLRRAAIFLLVAVLALAALAITPWGSRAIDAGRLLADMGMAGAGAVASPTGGGDMDGGEIAAARGVVRESISFAYRGRAYEADVYTVGEEPLAALVLVPGLAPRGKEDPRLVDLATTLARARFAVLVPNLPSLMQQRVSPDNVRQIADAIGYLAKDGWRWPRESPPVGVAAISYAVGPALLATQEPDVRGLADFAIAVGGYYDVDAVLTYFTSGFYRGADGAWIKGDPNVYGKWLFVGANANRILTLRDRILLTAIAGRKMDDPAADIADLVAKLGEEGRSVMRLLDNGDPDQAADLIAGLPPQMLADLRALDLKGRDLAGLPPKVLLLHGRDDRIIPVSQSEQLAAALPPGTAHMFIVDNLGHADLSPGSWGDIATLGGAAYELLSWRDAGAE